jgi:hypothetical protein
MCIFESIEMKILSVVGNVITHVKHHQTYDNTCYLFIKKIAFIIANNVKSLSDTTQILINITKSYMLMKFYRIYLKLKLKEKFLLKENYWEFSKII